MKLFKYQSRIFAITTLSIISGAFAINQSFAESQQFTAHLNKALEITVPSSAELDVTASSSGTFKSKSINVTAGTNGSAGYTLSMTTTSNALANTNDNTATIPSITSSTTSTAFPTNTWGYSTASGSSDTITYNPIPTGTTTLNRYFYR